MKKRILSLLLAVLMVVSVIPAFALFAFADDVQAESITYRTDKTYEGYKDLFVSDGLYAYVNMSGITADNTGTNEAYDANDIFIQGTDVNGTSENSHYFIKVLDGEIKDNFLMLTSEKGGTIAPDANGTLKFSGYTVSNPSMTSSGIGVYLASYYPSGTDKGQIGGVNRINGTSGYGQIVYGTQTDFYYVADTADSNGRFGGFSIQANAVMDMTSALPQILVDEQTDITNGTVGASNAAVAQKYKAVFIRGMFAAKSFGSLKLDRRVDTVILGTKEEHSQGKFLTVTNFDVTEKQYVSLYFGLDYITAASETGKISTNFAVNNNYTGVDELESRNSFNTVTNATINNSYGTYTNSAPILDATVFNYSSFRIYSRNISGMEINQNHFADLCYYYGLNVPESITNWAASGKVSMAGLYNKFVSYSIVEDKTAYATEIAEMQAILDNAHNTYAAPERDTIEDVYNAYKSLYYDDGHLISFVALNGIEDGDIVSQDSASFEDEINNGLLIVDGAKRVSGMYDQHNFIKIIGGKNAGKYYALGTSDSGNIGINKDGFVTFDESWQDDTNVGVFFGVVFEKEALHYKFQGINDFTTMNSGNQAAIDALNRYSSVETFFYPYADKQVNNTYGTYSLEQVAQVYHKEYQDKYFALEKQTDANIHLLHYGGGAIGTLRLHAGDSKLSEFGTGIYHNLGAWDSMNLAGGGTIHYNYESFYISNSEFENSIRILVNSDGTTANNGKIRYAGGDVATYNFSESNAKLAHVIECGKYTYYMRLYDCALTDAQMLQNHFADLALYYRLDVSELLPFGQAALTDSFLMNFIGYSVGEATETQVGKMNNAIAEQVAKMASASIDELKTQIGQIYTTINDSKNASAEAVSGLQAVINGLNTNKEELESILAEVAGLQGAIDILTDSITKLDEMISKVQDGKLTVDELNAIVIAAEAAAKQANEAAQATSDVAEVFQNLDVANANLPKAVENANKAVLLAAQASAIANDADAVIKYARVAEAKEKMDTTEYIKFQGYQVRVNDYAAVRALFAHDTAKINAGYTYEGQSFAVAAIGYVYAGATADISDITVMKSGDKYISAASDSKVVMHDAKYAVDATTKSNCVNSNLDIYAFVNSMHDVGVANYKTAFTKDYMYRAFIVFEGEGTSFINYVDCVSVNLGESTSVYDIASYAKQIGANEWYMDPKGWIAKVIFYSEDN